MKQQSDKQQAIREVPPRYHLPSLARVEDLPDPKAVLNEALLRATDKPARRLRKFRTGQAVQRLAELIQDYSPLRSATAFRTLEEELRTVLCDLK